jgi:hypothetical protein
MAGHRHAHGQTPLSSLLRMSARQRLAGAVVLIGALWVLVFWAVQS